MTTTTVTRPAPQGRAATARPLPTRPADPTQRRHRRPDLQVVPDAATERRPRRVGLFAGVGLAGLFALLFAVAVLQTVLVQGQLRLDDLQTTVAEEQVRLQDLRSDVAELDSPARIVEWAEGQGLVEPDSVQNVVPRAPGLATQ